MTVDASLLGALTLVNEMIGATGVVACRAKVNRSAVALESPTTVLMVSGGDVPPNL